MEQETSGQVTRLLEKARAGDPGALAAVFPLVYDELKRIAAAPEVPTVAESGVPGFDFVSWQLIVAPAGTPKDIIDKLHGMLKDILVLAEIQKEFADTARIPVQSPPPAELERFVKSEIVRLGKVVEAAGIAKSQ